MVLSLSSPLSIYAIPAMWVVSYYPGFKKGFTMRKAGSFNNIQPRSNVARLSEKKDVPPELVDRLARMEGAHLNGLENLPFFGLAVLAGNYAGIDNYTLNKVSGLYILTRILYNYIYINQTTQRWGGLRSIVWIISLGFPSYLFFKAAQLLSEKGSSLP
ncbi:hypothetical protein BYT27DRAFT_7205671 [Phlegmacium glaucopus]|nr:hypothetical protein BYT27DRAFT_7205671 [Phlegmacium glaucopus]